MKNPYRLDSKSLLIGVYMSGLTELTEYNL